MLLIVAIVSMFIAVTFYTIGVWGEKRAGRLTPKFLAFFWTGFVFDTTGTTVMSMISGSFSFNVHGVTGALAIVLMLAHAVWASIVLAKKDEKAMGGFHRYSIIVWAIWLVPFFTGMALAMLR
ncbi:MAG: TIGR03987 family protein [Spirochaetes bacterium]|nr:TIGR03987 family protein [Spirochaetota bacterium]MBU1080512.1 TIGR03987 family protein [Spirochaetota bacterium]